MVPKTAVIGADGFIGRHLFSACSAIYPASIGTSRRRPSGGLRRLDLLEPDISGLQLAGTGHEAAVITAGMTKVNQCEEERELARRVNVQGTISVALQLQEAGIVPVFLSSDHVFDGKAERGYTEADPTCPVTEYGREKAEVEQRLLDGAGPCLIVRLSKVFGLTKQDCTLLDEMAQGIVRGEEIAAAHDQVFCPTLVKDVVRALLRVLEEGLRGVIHVCSPEVWSRYDLAVAVADALGASRTLVRKISLDDLPTGPQRPKKTDMRCERLHSEARVDFTPMALCMDRLKENYRDEREQ